MLLLRANFSLTISFLWGVNSTLFILVMGEYSIQISIITIGINFTLSVVFLGV